MRAIINSFTYTILFDEEALSIFENDIVRDTFRSIIKDGGQFLAFHHHPWQHH